MPLIGLVENIVSAQTFAKIYRYEVDATQELLSLGVVNIANCFVSGYPVTGSFSRTAVNAASGVATQLGGELWLVVTPLTRFPSRSTEKTQAQSYY